MVTENYRFQFEQDCSYQGEALSVPTASKVYGAAVKTLKKLNEIKKKTKIYFSKI